MREIDEYPPVSEADSERHSEEFKGKRVTVTDSRG